MSFLNKLQTMTKLKDFLTPKNLELLDLVLEGLTDPAAKAAFAPFWDWFRTKRPKETAYACGRLEALRAILKEYRGV